MMTHEQRIRTERWIERFRTGLELAEDQLEALVNREMRPSYPPTGSDMRVRRDIALKRAEIAGIQSQIEDLEAQIERDFPKPERPPDPDERRCSECDQRFGLAFRGCGDERCPIPGIRLEEIDRMKAPLRRQNS